MKMKASLIQNDMRRMRCWRYLMPRRWYSVQMKMAEMTYPALFKRSALVE